MPTAHDRMININASIDPKSPNGYSFSLDDGKGGAADLVFNKYTSNMKKDGFYLIEFRLTNAGGSNLTFSKDRDKVLWACAAKDAVNGCPPDNSHMDTIFYVHPTKKIEDNKLYVINTDMDVLDFKFAFNFINEGNVGPKYVTYDPGGSNQNGGLGVAKATNTFVGVALAAAAIAACTTYALLR